MTDSFMFDVLGLGALTIDDLLYIEAYPPADTKTPFRERQRRLGGLTAVALAAAARLGCKTAYAGVVGHDALSEEAINALAQYGIDLTYLVRRPNARIIAATVIVGSNPPTRTIFYDPGHLCGADPEFPDADVIRAARVLFVDYIGIEGMLRAAHIARAANIPIVADFEAARSPRLPELIGLVDHLILPYRFAAQLAGESSPALAAERLWTKERQVVVVTCGVEGAWYVSGENQTARHQPAFAVKTVDSTGCGDVFHGAYAATLARGLAIDERIRFAAAAAALKAARPDELPEHSTVESFLKAYPL